MKDLRRRVPELAKGWGQIAPLLLEMSGGNQKVNCANTELQPSVQFFRPNTTSTSVASVSSPVTETTASSSGVSQSPLFGAIPK